MEIFNYRFKDEALLREALTTPERRMDEPGAADNQRLEFLGDAVLGLLSAELLFGEFPSEREGSLTVRRAHIVSSAALCEAADRAGLGGLLIRNRGAKKLPKDSKILADAVEAVLGAAYVDGGLEAARTVFEATGVAANALGGEWSGNPKGELQVRTQAMNPPRLPAYEIVSIAGVAHKPVFTVRVEVEGAGSAVASAGSRHGAESAAAAELLKKAFR
ncbi:MAG: ribonuclease III [Kiritimatiellae bacterium]|nr:ribonuclease III [Kiritimatiellia bacterium]